MIQIVEYDQSWPHQFQEESSRILAVTGDVLISIEHIGSTAVEGFVAKPIIDLAGAVEKLEVIASIIDPLVGLGYEYYGEYGLPGRHFFVRPEDGHLKCHLHVVEMGSWQWTKHLAFRDALRVDTVLRDEYENLKCELAVRFQNDSEAYSEAKGDFVERVLKVHLGQL